MDKHVILRQTSNGVKKALILILVFYVFALIQSSFLVFFTFKGIALNLILISVILINIIESSKGNFGIFAAVAGGFFLDIFSGKYFGINTIILLSASIFIKKILKRYFQISI
ncbi:MAG: rod shape-determining protein MreD [Candidatus Nealsonbacteria bacterium CG_4_10_14_0_2_um_filter_38_17]|uniref:Rod shape-determining protein MreD n=2 Tax=Candidatus Nealsoniibacteriota TaxID=1817911 RepID=A0A2M7UZ87_9BACT|nr:MAG: rod shape-determining protein MreD [Candidatus Nealsonbacteria bacterium CG23_combo_of_CG06-09_8_20_14_all_38_19]PIZ89175.1 MAG: rod shape-determining protein MreD [Candidatus Nealsonbacteria bacterium CG_4_10_14_0_2_um_filter_38_17]